MGTDDLRDKAEELKGKAKQAAGDLTDNERLEAEGAAQEAKAKDRQDVREAAEDLRESVEAEQRARQY
jgi:uncharacterized protein YjbJ (UPF0337 family)